MINISELGIKFNINKMNNNDIVENTNFLSNLNKLVYL